MSRLLEQLRRRRDDRGMMADLRCTLVESKKHRAWPVLHRLGVALTNREAAIVAALYATHPEETREGNLGATCRAIERSVGDNRGDDSRLTSTERRFLHLLAAEKGDELHERVTRMVLMARSHGVPVNYEQLETDLKFWKDRGDRVRTGWADSFWNFGVDAPLPSGAEEGGEQ